MTNSQSTTLSHKTSLLLIDGHRVFREAMMRFLHSFSESFSIRIASRSTDGITLAQTLQPQIILLDLSMSAPSELGVIPHLQRAALTARIIALTIHDDLVTRDNTLRAGAHDFVTKQKLPDELMPATWHHLPPFFAPSQQPGIST